MHSVCRLAAVVLLTLGIVPVLRAADDDPAARRTQAEALLEAMHTEQVLVHATSRVHELVDKYSQQTLGGTPASLTPEQKDTLKRARDDAGALIDQQLGWAAVKGEFIQAYADAFTADELKGLAAFYASPLGQKLVEKQPAVTEKMGELTQQKMLAAMPAVMQKIKDGLPKTASAAPSVPVPTPVPAIPAAPAAAPTPAAAPAR